LDTPKNKIESQLFYAHYHGHPISDLDTLHQHLRSAGKNIVWLAGDSSLDNKHWLYRCSADNKKHQKLDDDSFTGDLTNGYEKIVEPARGVKDVCFSLNRLLQNENLAVINCAVEESTLLDRKSVLLRHDDFIRENMTADDYLIVSIGGNDIALRPAIPTMLSVGLLNFLAPLSRIEHNYGIGSGYLKWLFNTQTSVYIKDICTRKKPRKVIICLFYYPSVAGRGWADTLLNFLGYSKNPKKIQAIIDMVFRTATTRIKIDGVEVVHVALSSILDPNNPLDYENRVEPSVQGGEKMANAFYKIIVDFKKKLADISQH